MVNILIFCFGIILITFYCVSQCGSENLEVKEVRIDSMLFLLFFPCSTISVYYMSA